MLHSPGHILQETRADAHLSVCLSISPDLPDFGTYKACSHFCVLILRIIMPMVTNHYTRVECALLFFPQTFGHKSVPSAQQNTVAHREDLTPEPRTRVPATLCMQAPFGAHSRGRRWDISRLTGPPACWPTALPPSMYEPRHLPCSVCP